MGYGTNTYHGAICADDVDLTRAGELNHFIDRAQPWCAPCLRVRIWSDDRVHWAFFLIGIGLSEIAERFGWLIDLLTFMGAGLIVYFGYNLFKSESSIDAGEQPKPTFWQGAALQWLNPKAWGACIAAVGLFELDQSRSLLYLFVGLYFFICFFGIGSWALFGSKVKLLLRTSKRRVVFNRVLGAILIILAVFLVQHQFFG